MNANATTEIRELTGHELDQVTGGLTYSEGLQYAELGVMGAIGAIVGIAVGSFFDWLFG